MGQLTRSVLVLAHLICGVVLPLQAQQAPPLSKSETN